ncbi:MAG: rhomboid family intramembrane serine protease [Syntrophobacteraceae bacterium]|nr:rhomboid family intramembrane serine protease [Syntrophobacteraceae bacterium]
MEGQSRNSLLCPKCARLVSIDEERCPYCGLAHPGSRWKNISFGRGLFASNRIVTNIIALNVGMFLLSILIRPGSIALSANPLHFLSPSSQSLILLGATGTIPIARFHMWWSLLSANYLHGGILHIFFNMMALWQIGPLVVQEFGAYRMFSIYTLSGIAGFLLSYLVGVPLTLGASAAVCGLIGATLYFGKSRGGQYGQMVYQQVIGWVIAIFAFGFLVPGINNWAHGGGLACGVLAGYLLGYQERRGENLYDKLLGAICAAATLAVLFWSLLWSFLVLTH